MRPPTPGLLKLAKSDWISRTTRLSAASFYQPVGNKITLATMTASASVAEALFAPKWQVEHCVTSSMTYVLLEVIETARPSWK
jgi:hypothetical protein